MPVKSSGTGIIVIVCSRCNYVFYEYMIGEDAKDNKSKYNGPPVPARALHGYGYICPGCNMPVDAKPKSIEILTRRQFNERYTFAYSRQRKFLVERSYLEERLQGAGESAESLVTQNIRSSLEPADIGIGGGAPSSNISEVEDAGERI